MPNTHNDDDTCPSPIGVTFAIEHLEDSPTNYILATYTENAEDGSLSLDMRVADKKILKMLLQHILVTTSPGITSR